MTGRELILYILENGLEDKDVFENGKFVGFLTPDEVAMQMTVGTATVLAWIQQGRLPSETVKGGIYIPINYKSPLGEKKNTQGHDPTYVCKWWF